MSGNSNDSACWSRVTAAVVKPVSVTSVPMPTSPRRWWRAARWAAVLAGCALLASGCWSGPGQTSVAHLGTTAATRARAGPRLLPSPLPMEDRINIPRGWPTPSACAKTVCPLSLTRGPGGLPGQGGPGQPRDPGSPHFQHAQQICQKLLPNGGQPSPAAEARALADPEVLAVHACSWYKELPGPAGPRRAHRPWLRPGDRDQPGVAPVPGGPDRMPEPPARQGRWPAHLLRRGPRGGERLSRAQSRNPEIPNVPER